MTTGSTLLRLEACRNPSRPAGVSDLSFDVKASTITSLIGGNGAGKTTAFNLITGNLAPMRGRSISAACASMVCRRTRSARRHRARLPGIAAVQPAKRARQHRAAIPGQRGESIVRSLIGGRGLRQERDATAARSSALLKELTIEAHADSLAERLSYGQQKLLGLGHCSRRKRAVAARRADRGLSPAWSRTSAPACAA